MQELILFNTLAFLDNICCLQVGAIVELNM